MASNFAIRHAAHQVRHGGIIVYPTETIYGLGCDPMNVEAVNTLCKLKNRDIGKGLILLANRLELFADYIESLDADAQNKINQRAKPTSWVVPAKKYTIMANGKSGYAGHSYHTTPCCR